MTNYTLTTPREADTLIGRMFVGNRTCTLSVREDKAFKDSDWFDLGEITLHPNPTGIEREQRLAAAQRGAFEWNVPDFTTARASLLELLGLREHDAGPKLRRCLDAIAAIGIRTGLQHPKFDPHAFALLPFRRSTTVVADTSGAVQGGLDFVARFLHPAARVKVPAIVQMEIVNFADRFLVNRRSSKIKRSDLLVDHLMSQGGQRVLLRLELQTDTEIERTFLLGDPLRSAFQSDKDPDVKDLNVSSSIRAYVDRLILEAARHHQAQANLGHKVQLLTSDQGLARMALAEGIQPLFFRSVAAADFFGKRLTGITLDPFTGQLRETPISAVLWELATAFGSARIEANEKKHRLTVSAFGDGLTWSPYQSHADLLWLDQTELPNEPTLARPGLKDAPINTPMKTPRSEKPSAKKPHPSGNKATGRVANSATIPLQRFSVDRLLDLVDALDNRQSLMEDDVVKIVAVRNRASIDEYRRFLASADLVTVEGGEWRANDKTQSLAIALREEDIIRIRRLLLEIPSFALFAKHLSKLHVGEAWDPKADFGRGVRAYITLGEITHLAAPIPGEGLYSTAWDPTAEEFARVAIERFQELDREEGLVASGAWLEEMVRKDGINPEVARLRLSEASAAGFLTRSAEGSTTDVKFDNHVIHVLRLSDGKPVVRSIHLYRGDFLIPGRSSTSVHIEGPDR